MQKPIEIGSKPNITNVKKLHPMYYTEEQDAKLKDLWETKMKAEDIAKEIGKTLSSVRTRARRIGLPRRVGKDRIRGASPVFTKDYRPPEISISFGTPKSLIELTNRECHWPLEGTNLYCGAPCKYPYCREHTRIAFR